MCRRTRARSVHSVRCVGVGRLVSAAASTIVRDARASLGGNVTEPTHVDRGNMLSLSIQPY